MAQQHDGNGRLWERFELVNINDRIENLYQHFKTGQRGELGLDTNEQQHYMDKIRHGISEQLNDLLRDLENKFDEQTKGWKEENMRLKDKIDGLNQRLRDANHENTENSMEKRKLQNKYKALRTGLDQIMNNSNAKNQDRIKNLSEKCRKATNERDNAIKKAKKDKKLHQDIVNQLQEKVDQLEAQYSKLSADRADIAADRDTLAHKCASLEGIIRENRESETDGLKEQLEDVKGELNQLQRKCDDLKRENTNLNEDYHVLQNKYGLEKEAFKKAIEKHQMDAHFRDNEALKLDDDARGAIKEVRDKLNRLHQQEIKKREDEWTKAKNDSMKTLDGQYNQINQDKDNQIKALKTNNKDLKQAMKGLKDEITRLKKENEERETLLDRIQEKNAELEASKEQLVQLRTELSKYKILWQHFFGFAPLKDEIEKVNTTLDQFEKDHQISSPIPKKKRRVIVESLSRWKDPHPPLELEPPPPNDEFQRLELYNVDNKKTIELRGFKLMNGKGDTIPLEPRQINPGGCIGIALRKKKTKFDLLYEPSKYNNRSKSFCKFAQGEEIWLCDSFDDKMQLFPKTEGIYDDLTAFDDESPIYVKQFFNEDDGYRGFEFGNKMKRRIKLKNMCFKNRKDTLRVPIPAKSLPRNGVIRLIIGNDRNHPRIRDNDLIVSPDDIRYGVDDDALLLCDQFGKAIELYNLEAAGVGATSSARKRGSVSDSCFIM
eukprot:162653_1